LAGVESSNAGSDEKLYIEKNLYFFKFEDRCDKLKKKRFLAYLSAGIIGSRKTGIPRQAF